MLRLGPISRLGSKLGSRLASVPESPIKVRLQVTIAIWVEG